MDQIGYSCMQTDIQGKKKQNLIFWVSVVRYAQACLNSGNVLRGFMRLSDLVKRVANGWK